MNTRSSWDDTAMQIAYAMANRSTCERRNVGAVLSQDKHIIATGYNGAPQGAPHCAEAGCVRAELKVPSGERHELCRGVHAEQNVIIQAALHGTSTKGATLHVTHYPCSICAKLIVNAGIRRVVYGGSYPDDLAQEVLMQGGVKVEHYPVR